MTERTPDVDYEELQRRYGGRYVARVASQILADAESYDQLCAQLETMKTVSSEITVEYVDPPGVVGVY
jgi:hypothetical protein